MFLEWVRLRLIQDALWIYAWSWEHLSLPEIDDRFGGVGLWDFSTETRYRLAHKARVSPRLSQLWFDRSFGPVMGQVALAEAG